MRTSCQPATANNKRRSVCKIAFALRVIGGLPPKNWRRESINIVWLRRDFGQLRDLIANVCRLKEDIVNRQMALQTIVTTITPAQSNLAGWALVSGLTTGEKRRQCLRAPASRARFLQHVSIASYPKRCISYDRLSDHTTVCLSQSGIMPKRLQLRSCGLHWRIAPWV